MIWLNMLKSLLSVLQSEVSPSQIAWGAALGAVVGFAPFSCLHKYIFTVIILLVNVDLGAAALATTVFGLVGLTTDPIADWIGYYLLTGIPLLQPLWVKLFNMPIVPFTRFYNTVVLGNFIISLLLFVPVIMFTRWFVRYYRTHLSDKVARWKIMQLFNITNTAYSIYKKKK